MALNGNERFNAKAAAWDANPDVHRASEAALQAILAAHPALASPPSSSTPGQKKPAVDVLEIGCGTGLLSLRLAPYVSSILAVDAAEGMVSALQLKLGRLAAGEGGDEMRRVITPLCIMLEDPEDPRLPPADPGPDLAAVGNNRDGPRKKFDLVISHLVLHHIADLRSLLTTMYGCLKPGGEVALTDYEDFGPEARKFHPESKMFGVERHGVNAQWFAGLMREAGFDHVDVSPKWTMEKEVERFPGEWGEQKPKGKELATIGFPFLLCRGRKGSL